MLPRCSPQPFLVAAFVLLSAGFASAAPLVVPWPYPSWARPVSCSCAAFVFVRFRARRVAGRLPCCSGFGGVLCFLGGDEFQTGGALWFEMSFHVYVSESSWETAFRGDEFEATESWETVVSDDKFVTGMATWNETDSLNSVWQSPKFNLPGSFHMKEEQNSKAVSHQFWKDFYLCFFSILGS